MLTNTVRIRLAYAVAGCVFGAFWAYGNGHAPLEHVLRLTAILAVATPAAHLVRSARARRGRASGGPHVPLRWLVTGKVALVATALTATLLLGGMGVPATNTFVGAGLALVTAFGGPYAHRRPAVPVRECGGS